MRISDTDYYRLVMEIDPAEIRDEPMAKAVTRSHGAGAAERAEEPTSRRSSASSGAPERCPRVFVDPGVLHLPALLAEQFQARSTSTGGG
ncbi:MAG: hypothetical protein U0R69_10650 [Gaiellales bacterium]